MISKIMFLLTVEQPVSKQKHVPRNFCIADILFRHISTKCLKKMQQKLFLLVNTCKTFTSFCKITWN